MALIKQLFNKPSNPPPLEAKLLPQALAGLQEPSTLHILDCGSGFPATLDLLSPAKVYFLDLEQTFTDTPEIEVFAESLSGYTHEIFDICLFGDLLQRLEPEFLRAFSAALEPYICQDTVGHSICQYPSAGQAALSFHCTGLAEFETRPVKRKYPAWSQSVFNDNFSCMQITDDYLTTDLRLELFLQPDC